MLVTSRITTGIRTHAPLFVCPHSWIPNTSVTHMEIQHGALRDGNPDAAYFIRDDQCYAELPEAHKASFVDTASYPVAALAELKVSRCCDSCLLVLRSSPPKRSCCLIKDYIAVMLVRDACSIPSGAPD